MIPLVSLLALALFSVLAWHSAELALFGISFRARSLGFACVFAFTIAAGAALILFLVSLLEGPSSSRFPQ